MVHPGGQRHSVLQATEMGGLRTETPAQRAPALSKSPGFLGPLVWHQAELGRPGQRAQPVARAQLGEELALLALYGFDRDA